MSRPSPYPQSKRVAVCYVGAVLSYVNDKAEDRKSLNVGVADDSLRKAVKVIVYDPAKFPLFAVGNGLILRNFISKDDGNTLVVTKLTKVFKTAAIVVDEKLKEEATLLVAPKPADTITIAEAKRSPAKKRVSIQGRIIQNEVKKQVMVGNKPTALKTITVQDSSASCKVTLWRDFAEEILESGDYVSIREVVVRVHQNEPQLNTTHLTSVEKIDEPEEELQLVFVGFCPGEQDGSYTLLPDGDGDMTYEAEESVLRVALDLNQDADVDGPLSTMFPEFRTVCSIQGTNIIKMKLVE